MQEVLGKAKTVRELLSGAKYSIDYYQREYQWGTSHVAELLDDLSTKFLESYEETHPRSAVAEYGRYFLGSIIVTRRDGTRFIVDGQQRLTTLTLLLIYLHHLQANRDEQVDVKELIFSEKYARRSFNIDVEDRTHCMEGLYRDEEYEANGEGASVENLVARYQDIRELFPEELREDALPYFIDWLIENVSLIEILASTDADAYTIFETMNDRGLSLAPSAMLKGYLLANVSDPERRSACTKRWVSVITSLSEFEKDDVPDFFKAWLRSQHAQDIRERKSKAKPRDFDLIGTEFHRWVRSSAESLGLSNSDDFARFIEHDLTFYGEQYLRIRRATRELTAGLETIHYIGQHGFTLQHAVLLAPLRPTDPDEDIDTKLRLVADYLDILLARRLWNWKTISYSTMMYAMFVVMRDIRGKQVEELSRWLQDRLEEEQDATFGSNDRFSLHMMNRPPVHRLLARMTDFVDRESGIPSRYLDYVAKGKNRYEIEHIWADKPQRHVDEFTDARDFQEYRNRIGGLLLLPKSFNASYGDLTYKRKLKHYFGQNLLAQSLHPRCYERNPGFVAFVDRTGLPFRAHEQFKQADLDDRQRLYQLLCELIWNPSRLDVAEDGPEP